MYKYYAKVLRVIDRDTLELLIDLGMNHWIRKRVRFSDSSQHKLNTKTKKGEEEWNAEVFVKNVLDFSLLREATFIDHLDQPDVVVKTTKKFNHYIATVQVIGDKHGTIGERLKRAGF